LEGLRKREARSEEEKTFLISELALELARAEPKEAPGYLSSEQVREEILALIGELKGLVSVENIQKSSHLRQYVEDVFEAISP